MARPAPDLRTFSLVLEALYGQALDCLKNVEDRVQHKAWNRMAAHLSNAILAADDVCPVCGEPGPLTRCTWCIYEAHAGDCLATLHGGERACPHRPEHVKGYDGEPDPDIEF